MNNCKRMSANCTFEYCLICTVQSWKLIEWLNTGRDNNLHTNPWFDQEALVSTGLRPVYIPEGFLICFSLLNDILIKPYIILFILEKQTLVYESPKDKDFISIDVRPIDQYSYGAHHSFRTQPALDATCERSYGAIHMTYQSPGFAQLFGCLSDDSSLLFRGKQRSPR